MFWTCFYTLIIPYPYTFLRLFFQVLSTPPIPGTEEILSQILTNSVQSMLQCCQICSFPSFYLWSPSCCNPWLSSKHFFHWHDAGKYFPLISYKHRIKTRTDEATSLGPHRMLEREKKVSWIVCISASLLIANPKQSLSTGKKARKSVKDHSTELIWKKQTLMSLTWHEVLPRTSFSCSGMRTFHLDSSGSLKSMLINR